MVPASLGGIEGLKVSESLLRRWPPGSHLTKTAARPLQPDNTKDRDEAYESGGTAEEVPSGGSEAEGTARDAARPQARRRLPVNFLRRLAAQGTAWNSSALRGLNYEQIVMLLQENWSALAADGVNLSDFLTPAAPQPGGGRASGAGRLVAKPAPRRRRPEDERAGRVDFLAPRIRSSPRRPGRLYHVIRAPAARSR